MFLREIMKAVELIFPAEHNYVNVSVSNYALTLSPPALSMYLQCVSQVFAYLHFVCFLFSDLKVYRFAMFCCNPHYGPGSDFFSIMTCLLHCG